MYNNNYYSDFKMQGEPKLRIYNGCNHKLNWYASEDCTESSLRGTNYEQILLENDNATPKYVIPRQKPLETNTSPILGTKERNVNYFGLCENYFKYDIIAVSSIYAEAALQTFIDCARSQCIQLESFPLNWSMFDRYNYLDRLYTVKSVFDKEKKVIGMVDFVRVIPAFPPEYYCDVILHGFTPSLRAVSDCINVFDNRNCNRNTLNSKEILRNWLNAQYANTAVRERTAVL